MAPLLSPFTSKQKKNRGIPSFFFKYTASVTFMETESNLLHPNLPASICSI